MRGFCGGGGSRGGGGGGGVRAEFGPSPNWRLFFLLSPSLTDLPLFHPHFLILLVFQNYILLWISGVVSSAYV